MNVETLVVGSMATNCYIVTINDQSMIIDPGDDAEYIMAHVKNPIAIVATHGHFDHIMAGYALQLAYSIPFYMHPDDIFLIPRMESSAKHFLSLKHVDPPPKAEAISGLPFIHTPGHTPGSISLHFDDILIVGDTIFEGGMVGRTDHAYSKPLALSSSIQTILSYPKGTRILPGHGKEFSL